MTPRIIALSEISAVAASGTVTIKVPVGPRIRRVIVQHGFAAGTNTVAGAATNIAQMRFIIDERVQRTATGTQWRDQNLLHSTDLDFQGVPNTAPGVAMGLMFQETWRGDEEDQLVPALVTRWTDSNGNVQQYGSMRIELDLGAASTPTIVAWAEVDDYVGNAEPMFVKWSRLTVPAGSTEFDYTYTHRPSSVERLMHASWYPDSGGSNAATRIKLKDGAPLHDATISANQTDLINSKLSPLASGRTATIYDLKFDRSRNLSDTYGYGNNHAMVFTVTAGGAMSGNCPVIVARLGKKE